MCKENRKEVHNGYQTNRRTRCARQVRARVRSSQRRYSLRGSVEPRGQATAQAAQHRHRKRPHRERHRRQLAEISPGQRQEERRHARRDGRDSHPYRLLRRLAQRVGGIQHGEGSLCGRRGRWRDRRGQRGRHRGQRQPRIARRLLRPGQAQRRLRTVLHRPKLSQRTHRAR